MTTRINGGTRASASRLLSRRKADSPDQPSRAAQMESPPLQADGAEAIVVIDQRVLIRDCLVRCLKTANPSCIVMPFASANDWLAAVDEHPTPAVVVLSVQDLNGSDALIDGELAVLARHGISVPVVIISDAEDMNHVVMAFEQGVRGYIPTSVTLDVAVEAVRLVEAGGTFAPASAMMSWRRSTEVGRGIGQSLKSMFTARQMAVLTVLQQGKANKHIAHELNMREGTVKVHIRNIMRKLKAKNRTEVAILAHQLLTDRRDV
jgi:DNA-binding NarL/FixJ family response regulator